MPRFIFSPSSVSAGGAQAAVTTFLSEDAVRRVTDIWRVDGEDNLDDAIPNGVIISSTLGAIGSFAGPESVDTLWLEVNGNSASRTQVSAVRSSGAESAQPTVILIDDAESLPPGTPVDTIVVVKSA